MDPKSKIGKSQSKNPLENGTMDQSVVRNGHTNGHLEREPVSLKVLMYHRIVNDRELSDKCSFCVHRNDFHKQLELLSQLGYTPVTFRDYKLYLEGEILLPKKPVILTFDDGYMDTYQNAYPLLLEYGMRAVIFVLGDRNITTNIWDRDNPQTPVASLMQNHHIIELHSKGFEIGAHSLNHPDLQKLPEDQAFIEIKISRQLLESLIGSPVRTFCYPYGSVNAQLKIFAKNVGFDFACSVYTGPARFGEDPFEIRRLMIPNNTTVAGFVMRMKTPYEYFGRMWRQIKHVGTKIASNSN